MSSHYYPLIFLTLDFFINFCYSFLTDTSGSILSGFSFNTVLLKGLRFWSTAPAISLIHCNDLFAFSQSTLACTNSKLCHYIFLMALLQLQFSVFAFLLAILIHDDLFNHSLFCKNFYPSLIHCILNSVSPPSIPPSPSQHSTSSRSTPSPFSRERERGEEEEIDR